MHTDGAAIFINETIESRFFLSHGYADDRKARRRESAPHKLPVSAMSRRDHRASAQSQPLAQVFFPFDFHQI